MLTISIITAVFNNREHLPDTIASVLSQTYPNVEYIIVDGQSTDGTTDIIRLHEQQIARWVSEPDRGIYDALNKGIAMATGEVIGFLHSDDVFDNPSVVETIAKRFAETGCDATYGDLVYVSRLDIQNVVRYWKSNPFDVRQFRQGWMPPHPTLFMKRTVYDSFGGFNLHYHIAADYDFMLRTMASGRLRCEYIPQVITRMRTGGASNKSVKNILRKSYEDWQALRQNKKGGIYTLFLKNVSKLHQFIKR